MSALYRTLLTGGVIKYTMRAFPETNGITPPSGAPTGGYPVGVFNVNDNFLGFASNQSQYIALWNADAANQAYGTISAGDTSLTFESTSATIPNVRGCRYWQVDVRGYANLCTGRNDRVLVDSTITLATSSTRVFSAYTNYGIGSTLQISLYYAPGCPGGVSSANPQWANLYAYYDGEAKQININIGSTQKTVTVFHTEYSIGAGYVSNVNNSMSGGGMNDVIGTGRDSETLNLRGSFPPGAQHLVIFPTGAVRESCYPSNISNMNELTKVVQLDCGTNDYAARTYSPAGPWALANYDITGPWMAALPNKDILLTVIAPVYRLLPTTSSIDGTGISTGDFPNLKSIRFQNKAKPFNPSVTAFPLIDNYFSIQYGNLYGSEGWTGAEIDAIYNTFATRLAGITARGIGRLDVQWFNTTATAASLAARTYLSGQGWYVH